MKNKVGLILPFVLAVVSLTFALPVMAETGGGGGEGGGLISPEVTTSTYSQVIALQPGWNIVSTPRIVESHQFSVPETSDNFSIYLLNSSSSWSTMQDLNQTEFTPLFGYFIFNKTTSTQALTLNYKQDVDPAQRLFDRQLTPGWNVIGIANPIYALRQSDISGHGWASSILGSTKNCLSSVIDFTAGNADKISGKVSGSWNSRNIDDLTSLNDWRDTKAYGVYAESGCSYHGTQNETSTPGVTPENVEVTIVKNPDFADQSIISNTSYQKVGSFIITAGADKAISITSVDINLSSSSLGYLTKTSALTLCPDNSFCSSNGNTVNIDNHFPTDIIIAAGMSKVFDVYLEIGTLTSDDVGKSIISNLGVTARAIDSVDVIPTEMVTGQIMTVAETLLPILPPTLNINFNNNSGGYLMGGSLVNGLLNYNINSPDDSVLIKQLYFKVNSSNPNYSAFSTISVNNDYWNSQWLGGSLVSTSSATTTISLNELNIARNSSAYVSVGGQLSNIGSMANPSGIETSISLVGVRFTDSSGNSHEQYYGDEVYKSPNYVAIAARPYVNLEPVSNSLVLGNSKITRLRMYSSGNDVDAVVRIKSLPLHIITSNARFNTSTNSLVLKNADGTIINTTNTSCVAGDCVITFVEPYAMIGNYHYNFDVFAKDVNYTDEQPGGLSAVTVSLGDKSLFIWDDVKGNLNDIAGMYDNNWPTNTVTTLRFGSAAAEVGSLTVTKNSEFGDQNYIPSNYNDQRKIGSFVLAADSKESIKITNINIGLSSSTLDYTSKTHDLSIRFNGQEVAAHINPLNGSNNFSTNITLNAGDSKIVDVYLDMRTVTGADAGKNIITNIKITAEGVNSGAPIASEKVIGQTITIDEIMPIIKLETWRSGGYVRGGLTDNQLLNYYFTPQIEPVLVKQMYFKINSSDSNYLPLSNLAVFTDSNQRLGGSVVSANSTTTVNVNLNIANNNNVFIHVGGQLSNISSISNPSGLVTSISLVGIKYSDSSGNDHVQYYSDEVYKSPDYLAVTTWPYLYMHTVPNSLSLGMSRIARIDVGSSGNQGSINIKSLPLHITTNAATFSTSTDSLVVKNSNGDIVSTTNTSCASGDCIVNFVNAQTGGEFYLYAKEVNYTMGEWAAISTSMGDKNLFNWDDVTGGLNGISGEYDNNWPIDTITTVSSGSGEPMSSSLIFSKNSSSLSGAVTPGCNSVDLAKFDVEASGEDMELRTLSLGVVKSGATNLTGSVNIRIDGMTVWSGTASNITNSSTPSTINLQSYPTIKSGVTSTITVIGNISWTATSDDSYKVYLDINNIKRLSTNDISDADVDTESGNSIAVQAIYLKVTTLSTPVAQTTVNGNDFEFANFELNAESSGEDVKVSKIIVSDTIGAGATLGQIGNLRIYQGTTLLETSNNTSNGAASTTFTFKNQITVAKGTSIILRLLANVSGSTSASNQTHTFYIASNNDVDAIGASTGNSISDASLPVSGSGQAITLVQTGSATATLVSGPGASPTSDQLINVGTTDGIYYAFKLIASNEAIKMRTIKITAASSAATSLDINDLRNIRLLANGTVVASADQMDSCSAGVCTLSFTSTDNIFGATTVGTDAGTAVTVAIKADIGSAGTTGLGNNFRFYIASSTTDLVGFGVNSESRVAISGTPTVSAVTYVTPFTVVVVGVAPTAPTSVGTPGGINIGVFRISNYGSTPITLARAKFIDGGASTSTKIYKLYASADGGTQSDISVDAAATTTDANFVTTGLTINGGSWRFLTIKQTQFSADNDTYQLTANSSVGDFTYSVTEPDLGYDANGDGDMLDTSAGLGIIGNPTVERVTAKN